jgi:AcrR family transcriptional regulator
MSDRNDEVKGYFDDYVERLEAYEHFNAIGEETRQRVIRAALEEFAANDYRNASTNAIVAKAGISKGLLFRYFADKAGLFGYLQTYVAQKLTREVLDESDFEGDDIFEVLKRITDTKLLVTARHPLEVGFLVRTMKSDLPPELHGAIDETVARAYDSLPLITACLDDSLLKDGLDRDQVIKLIDRYCIGMTNEVLQDIGPIMPFEQYEELTETIEDQLDFLRDLVYKEDPRRTANYRHFR